MPSIFGVWVSITSLTDNLVFQNSRAPLMEKDALSRLPLELFHCILNQLSPQTLLICRQVCTKWENAVSSSLHLHQHFRLRLIDGSATLCLAANPHTRWLFQLKHRTFVCMGNNWWLDNKTLPYSSGVHSLTIDCCCHTIREWRRPRTCLLNHSWTDYSCLVEFNLVLYPAPSERSEIDTWFYAGSLINWPQRFDLPAAVNSVPENVDTFPLLALPQIQHCVLAMDSINPDYDVNAWAVYNQNFGRMYNMTLLINRIAQLTTFTGWFWAVDSQVIVEFERKLVQALQPITTDKQRVFNLYFTPSRPVWPTTCPKTHKLPLICALTAASVRCGCRYFTTLTKARQVHYDLASEALIRSGCLINLKAGTRNNLAKSLKLKSHF